MPEIPSVTTKYGEIEAIPDPDAVKNIRHRDYVNIYLQATLLRLRMGYEESISARLARYIQTLHAYERMDGCESYSLLEIAKIDLADALLRELDIATKPEIPESVRSSSLPAKYKKAEIPTELRWRVWERDDFTCKKCGSRRNLSIDHIVAEVKGGVTEESNLQTLCGPCNSRKGPR